MLPIEEQLLLGEKLFTDRLSVLSLWQTLAENFYPERADFTVNRSLGTEFGENLMTSYPVLMRRELGNAFSTMLRPTAKDWFSIKVDRIDDSELGSEAKRWIERATRIMRKLMMAKATGFVKATKQGDQDLAAFGQCAISVEPNRELTNLLFRSWHLRDVAWMVDETDTIDTVYRKWKPTARDILRLWPKTTHENIRSVVEKEPFKEFEVWHCIRSSKDYLGDKKYKTPFVSYYIDVANKHEMECTGSWTLHYSIPRLQLVSGSQYAYSPATITSLANARSLQTMYASILESGERAANPPMIAVQEAIRSDVSIYAGGITYVDAEYDERLGEVLRPVSQDYKGLPIGMEMIQNMQAAIGNDFYANKLTMPQYGPEMTAFEVGQRVQEHIRQQLPLFEPIEVEYNASLCETAFELYLRFGAFGPMSEIPQELQGANLTFVFETPLHQAVERAKGQVFLEAKSLLVEAAQLNPGVVHLVDPIVAVRDVLTGIETPETWIRTEGEVSVLIEADNQKAQAQQQMAMAESLTKSASQADISAKDFINPNV